MVCAIHCITVVALTKDLRTSLLHGPPFQTYSLNPEVQEDCSYRARSAQQFYLRGGVVQGIERMPLEEIQGRAAKDFGVCEELLTHHPFLTGPTPTAADCFLFALLDLVRLSRAVYLGPVVTVASEQCASSFTPVHDTTHQICCYDHPCALRY
jgi:glutathione S-transferase